MKRIVKSKPPAVLKRWLRRQHGLNCTYDHDLSGVPKQALHEKLMKEQGWLCGYTGIRIAAGTSHIEHIYPHTLCRQEPGLPELYGAKRDVDYYNVIAAFPKDDLVHRDQHPYGAKSRGDWYDSVNFIHPLLPDCEARFNYNLFGEILPADNDPAGPAAKTIEHLKLNHSVLNELRRAAIEARLFDDDVPLSEAQIRSIKRTIYQKDRQGRYEGFCFVLDHACRELLEKVRREKARHAAIRSQQTKRKK